MAQTPTAVLPKRQVNGMNFMERSEGLETKVLKETKVFIKTGFSDGTVRVDFKNQMNPRGINDLTPPDEGTPFEAQ